MRVTPTRVLSAEVDVAPMIGVLLVLLIVVMTTRPTMKTMDASLWSPTPDGSPCICDEFGLVVLEVFRGHVYRVNNRPVEASGLQAHLAGIYRAQAEKEIVIEGYPTATYGDVVAAIDVAKSAGARAVDIPPREVLSLR
jgi:biopolymer transport protein TolR